MVATTNHLMRALRVRAMTLTDARRSTLAGRIRWFVAATISYNIIEAAVAITEGARVSSTALIGFGLDSAIEVASAAAVAWQFAGPDPQRRERVALKIIACSFFALATYVTVEAVRTLGGGDEPQRSTVGIVLVAISVVIMPVLSWAQRSAGREFGSASAVADSRQTLLCTYLSAAVLLGLVLNATLGWSWADPVVALGLAGVAVREGRQALRGDTCCPPIHLDDHATERDLTVDRVAGEEGCGCRTGCTEPCCAPALPHADTPP